MVTPIGAAGLATNPPVTGTRNNPEWPYQTPVGNKSPIIGGRVHQRMRQSTGMKTLASLITRASVNSPVTELTDVTADDAFCGATELTLVTTPNVTYTIAPTAVNSVAVNVSGGIIRWWFRAKSNVFSNIDKMDIQIFSSGSATSVPTNYHCLNPSNPGFGQPSDFRSRFGSDGSLRWWCFAAPVSQFGAVGTGADLTQITWARLVLRSKSSGVSMTIAIGNIEYIPNGLSKAKFIFGFDDANSGQVTYAAPILAKYGFRAVLYPSAAIQVGLGGKISANQIKSLHDNLGWQIASQAWSSELNTLIDGFNDDQRTAEMGKLRNWHNSLGVTGGDHGSYFSGVGPSDMVAYPMFRQHFRSMRAFGGGNSSGPPFVICETYPWGDRMAIRALDGQTYADSTGFTNLQAHIDQAIANVGVSFMVWHNPQNYPTSFAAVCAYLDANRSSIDVVTEDDLALGNGVL